MQLSRIRISNFKGIREAVLDPSHFACLVGENNAGKSSVLQSIVYSLNRPSTLPLDLFYDTTSAVVFNLKFDGILDRDLDRLSQEHRGKIDDLINEGRLELTVRYPPSQKCEVTTLRSAPIEPRYRTEAISGALAGKRGAALKGVIQDQYSEFLDGAPEMTSIGQAKEYLRARISELPANQFTQIEAPLPSGIPSSISALLPEPIYIPAVKNLGDDLKTSQSTPFGRLLGLLLEDMSPDLGQVRQSLETLNLLLNRDQGSGTADNRHRKVIELEAVVERYLGENFPKVKLELHVPPPELKTILNAAQIFVDDGSRDLVDNKGDGIKRSLTFALLQTYVHIQTAARHNQEENQPLHQPLLFLFEEPELYLHPKSQRVLFQTLAKIADSHQVIVTTHSPLFFEPGVTAAFVRVAKVDAEPKPTGTLYPVNFGLNPDSAEVFRLARFENADAAFFSRRVVLFEGESDDAYCKHVAKMLNPLWDFDRLNVALVRVSGKGNFSRYRRFFEAFGIEVKVVADLDAMFEGHHLLGGGHEFISLRQTALQIIDDRITAAAIAAEPTSRQIKDKVQSEGWKVRYNGAKASLAKLKGGEPLSAEHVAMIDNLFHWEQDTARHKACREDAQSRDALIPVLDCLRGSGICILSKGAIEDYYPDGVSRSSPKPERALNAAKLVDSMEKAIALSHPLSDARNCELHEVFEEIFRGLL